MIITNIIKQFSEEIEGKVGEILVELKEAMNFIKIEEILGNMVKSLVARMLEWVLNQGTGCKF